MLMAALLIGGFIRLYQLGAIPVSLYWDETAIGYDAYALTVWGKDMHGNNGLQAIFPSYGDYKLPMYIWLDSIVMRLTGPTPFGVRLLSALAGIALIALMYLLAKELFHNSRVAGIASLVLAFLPVDILFSRTGFESHLAVLFVGFTLYFWLLSRRKPWVLGISSITGAAAVYAYFSARIVVPLLAIVTLTTLWKQVNWRWRSIFVGSLLFWIVLLFPIYQSPYYDASNQFRLSTANLSDTGSFALKSNIMREQSGNGPISRIVYHRYLLQAKEIINHITVHFDPRFLFISGDMNLRHGTTKIGLLLLSMLPFFVIGWIRLIQKRFWVGLLLFGTWIASIIPAAIPMEVPHALRSLSATLVFPLVIAYGSVWAWSWKKWRMVIVILLSVAGLEFALFAEDYLVHYPIRSATAWQSGYNELASYLQQHQTAYDHCVVDFTDNRLYLYFLLTMKVDPQSIVFDDESFMVHTIGAYDFKSISSLPTARTWAVVSQQRWMTLNQPKADIIPDAAGAPLFYILRGGEL